MLFIHSNNIKLAHMGQYSIRPFILELPTKPQSTCYSPMEATQHHTSHTTVRGLSKTTPGIFFHSVQIFWNPNHGHPGFNKSPLIKMTLRQRVKQVGENPLPFRSLSKLPRNWYPRVVLSVGSNFASHLAGNRRSNHRES